MSPVAAARASAESSPAPGAAPLGLLLVDPDEELADEDLEPLLEPLLEPQPAAAPSATTAAKVPTIRCIAT